MKEHCEKLYQSLLKDIKESRRRFANLQKEIEHCFVLCNQYCAIIKHDVADHIFETEEEEIHFFKHLKPLFTSQVEYYSIYYHAHLYKNEVYDPVKVKQFWIREATRLDKFIAEHKDFYEYYKEGRTDKDNLYFTRGNRYSGKLPVHNMEIKAVTFYDPLIASLMALERYDEYIQSELQVYCMVK